MARRVSLIWIAGIALVLMLIGHDAAGFLRGTTTAAALWHRDFTNLWSGGRLIDSGEFAAIYDRQAFTAWQTAVFGDFGMRTFSYPPTLFPVAQAAALLPYRLAQLIWLGGTASLFVAAARKWWPRGAGPAWLAMLTPAALLNVSMGHMGFMFGAIWLAAFALLERRPVVAGALIGLFAMKPQLAILIPLVLLLLHDWRAIGAATVSAAGMTAASVVAYGIEPWRLFLFRAVGTQAGFVDAGGAGFGKLSTSAATAVLAVGGDWRIAIAAQAALGALGIALLVMAAIHKVPVKQLAMLAATATFLVLPYALAYDLTVVALGALCVMVDPRAGAIERSLAAIGFVAPQIGIIFAYLGLPPMPLMLAGLAIAQYRVGTGISGRADPAAAGAMRSA